MQFRRKNQEKKKSEVDREKRIFRIVSMLRMLGHGQSLSAKELAVDHSVSHRTVQRDVELLGHVGFPLVRDEKGRYRFMSSFRYGLPGVARGVELLNRQAAAS